MFASLVLCTSRLDAQTTPGRCLRVEITDHGATLHVTDTCRNQLIYVGAVPLHGHWLLLGDSCLAITANPGRDYLVNDTTIRQRMLLDSSLVADTTITEIMHHEQDTISFRNTCAIGSCLKPVTVHRGHYDSIRVASDSSVAVCDTICQNGWQVPRDSAYYVFTAAEIALLEGYMAGYTWSEQKCILIRMLPNGDGIYDVSQSRGYYDPYPDTLICSVSTPSGYNKYPLSYWVMATNRIIHGSRPSRAAKIAGVTDIMWQDIPCAEWDNQTDWSGLRRTITRNCRTESHIVYSVMMRWVWDSDTTMLVDTCAIRCPKIIATSTGHYVDSMITGGYYSYTWSTLTRDTCYTIGTQTMTYSQSETLRVELKTISFTDNVYQVWWNQFAEASVLSDSLCSPSGTVPVIIPYYTSRGSGWTQAIVRQYDIDHPGQPCPTGYDPLLYFCCMMDTTRFQSQQFLRWIRSGALEGSPTTRWATRCVDTVVKGRPELACWGWVDTTVVCMYADTINGEPVWRKSVYTLAQRRPVPCWTVTKCDTIRYRILVDSVWHGDTLRTQYWVADGWSYSIEDSCACTPTITLPDGIPHQICDGVIIRSECDEQPYWLGNTIVFPCAVNQGVTINGATRTVFTGIAMQADVEDKFSSAIYASTELKKRLDTLKYALGHSHPYLPISDTTKLQGIVNLIRAYTDTSGKFLQEQYVDLSTDQDINGAKNFTSSSFKLSAIHDMSLSGDSSYLVVAGEDGQFNVMPISELQSAVICDTLELDGSGYGTATLPEGALFIDAHYHQEDAPSTALISYGIYERRKFQGDSNAWIEYCYKIAQ